MIIRGLFGFYGFEYLLVAYVNIVFPICCIVELFITPRDRSPKLTADIMSIITFIVVFTAVEMIIFWLWSKDKKIEDYFVEYWVLIIARIIFSVLGYFVYDFCLYKKNAESGGYTLFRS